MQTFTDLCKHVFTDVTGYKSMHANQNPSPHLKATEFLQIHVFFLLPLLIVVFAALQSNSCFFLKLALIFVHFFPSPRVRRLASTWTQSSTSSARRSIRRTWKTFSERQRRGLWPSTENRGITRGRRNVSFCESFFFKKGQKATRTLFFSETDCAQCLAEIGSWGLAHDPSVLQGNEWWHNRKDNFASCNVELETPSFGGFYFHMLCLVFLCIFFFLRNFVLSLLLYCYFTKNIFIGGTELLFVLWCSFYNLKEWRRRKKQKQTKNPQLMTVRLFCGRQSEARLLALPIAPTRVEKP